MTDNVENFTHELLKKIMASNERIENDIRDIKFRVTGLEHSFANQSHRLDRMDDRLTRIEKRLDLVEA